MRARASIFVFCLASASVSTSTKASEPSRYSLHHIELEQYFKMPDLREASRLLLEDAQLAQIELDYKPVVQMPEILLPSGKMTPSCTDRTFFDKYRKSKASDTPVCILKFARPPTIREFAQMLENGIRLYRGMPYDSFIARVPVASFSVLSKMEAFCWIGEFLPTYKYDASTRFVEGRSVYVYSLPGDCAESREDLTRLGAKDIRASHISLITYRYEFYQVNVSPDVIPKLATLWWVQEIHLAGAATYDD